VHSFFFGASVARGQRVSRGRTLSLCSASNVTAVHNNKKKKIEIVDSRRTLNFGSQVEASSYLSAQAAAVCCHQSGARSIPTFVFLFVVVVFLQLWRQRR